MQAGIRQVQKREEYSKPVGAVPGATPIGAHIENLFAPGQRNVLELGDFDEHQPVRQ